MGNKPKVLVVKESPSGRNEVFKDTQTGKTMTRNQFVKQIEQKKYPDFHVRVINGQKTPVSNPDKSSDNNLG